MGWAGLAVSALLGCRSLYVVLSRLLKSETLFHFADDTGLLSLHVLFLFILAPCVFLGKVISQSTLPLARFYDVFEVDDLWCWMGLRLLFLAFGVMSAVYFV